LGIGDWGLGIGPNPQSPIPNPQSPNPHPPLIFELNIYDKYYNYFFSQPDLKFMNNEAAKIIIIILSKNI